MTRVVRALTCIGCATLVAACAVGPDYERPQMDAVAEFKETRDWKPSEPSDALSRGPWWEIFHDDVLDELEAELDSSNESIKAAEASFEQAQALLRQAHSEYFPDLSLNAARTRAATANASPTNLNTVGVRASWEADLWGQVRRSNEASRSNMQASAGTLASVRLSEEAALATTYFDLRAQDQLDLLLSDIVGAQQASLDIVQNRYRAGVAAKADVVSAETQLLSSQAAQLNASIQRAIFEHAIAVLVGQQPATFSEAKAEMRTDVPTVPPVVPSALLERRPDIATAERRVSAANAQIGVAKSAFFPSLTLSGSDQYSDNTLTKIVSTSHRVWSLGPAVALTLFDGGLRKAQVAEARAAYEASVDNYRETVLSGFADVEDDLVTLRVLEKQSEIEAEAVKQAREAEALTLNQYKAGTVPYSSVITAQTTRLSSEETALNVLRSRLTASVTLIEDLGGGWSASQLPK